MKSQQNIIESLTRPWAPAHCVVGVQKTRLRAREFEVENLIVHPDYVDGHPSNQHDLAVLKTREEPRSTGFEMYACLPEEGDDPVDECQAADYFQVWSLAVTCLRRSQVSLVQMDK